MDPLSQATLGAAAAALLSRPDSVRRAILVGAVAGALPDLDVLIKSAEDPLLQLEYHRHFTHALFAAPLIGLVVAAFFRVAVFRKSGSWRELSIFAIAGALTHGFLDTCTSYGTLLYLPFSGHRESWDIISIIDPLFTLPLVLLTVVAFVMRRPTYARVGLGLCLAYLCFGVLQRERAETVLVELAQKRGHTPVEISVRPSIANVVLWRLVYRSGETYHVDAVWILPWREPQIYPGNAVVAFSEEDAHLLVSEGTTQARDIERFRFFSQGYLIQSPNDPMVIGDLRYALLPNSTLPLWGVRVNPWSPGEHVKMETYRNPSESNFDELWAMIRGKK